MHGPLSPCCAQVLNDCMAIVREGGQIGIPGLYVTEDPGAVDDAAKFGNLSMRFGLGWSKSASMHTGQCPVMKYHRPLMNVRAARAAWRRGRHRHVPSPQTSTRTRTRTRMSTRTRTRTRSWRPGAADAAIMERGDGEGGGDGGGGDGGCGLGGVDAGGTEGWGEHQGGEHCGGGGGGSENGSAGHALSTRRA